MIVEHATITVDPDRAAAFEAAVAMAAPFFRAAQGCRGMTLDRCIEDPGTYLLRVDWDSVEDHMVTFRQSDGFQEWRRLASPFFLSPPSVRHYQPGAPLF